jgi:hypothetical protein
MTNHVFTPGRIFTLITFGALGGLVMGALFGVAAGLLTPTFFAHFIPWNDIEPIGFACVFGAFGGLFLGGGLAVFSLLLHLALRTVSREKSDPPSRP